MARETKTYMIPRDSQPDLRFNGYALGRGRDDYYSVTLFKTTGDNFVLAIETKNTFQLTVSAERSAYFAKSLEELLKLIQSNISGGVYNHAVKHAFLEASVEEPTLKAYAVQDIP